VSDTKLKEIIFFLIIFSFVTNALTVLSLTTTSFSDENVYDTSDALSKGAGAVTVITATVGGGIASALTVGIVGFAIAIALKVPPDKALGLSLFSGLLTSSFIGTFGTLYNMLADVPIDARIGMGVVLSIFFGIIGLLIVWTLIEILFGVSLDAD